MTVFSNLFCALKHLRKKSKAELRRTPAKFLDVPHFTRSALFTIFNITLVVLIANMQ